MNVMLCVRNESKTKRLCRADSLERLAHRVCSGEGVEDDIEVSLLFCDDSFIQELNAKYRKKNKPTDVLSFCQPRLEAAHPTVLGDVVISLETVHRRCERIARMREAMREEVRLLFCHGLLHLLGYAHAAERDRKRMAEKQALYLGLEPRDAWPSAGAIR